jgi:phospholipid/cholesterol/gamma-HCH transport system ATP-binding protein
MPISEASIAPLPPSDTQRLARAEAPPREVVARVEALVKTWGEQRVLDGVAFELERGRVYSVIGPSGCGKTTLLKSMLGLTPVTSGKIELFGTDIASAPPEQVDDARRSLGVVFQSSALISSMSVFENVALPLRQHTGKSREEINETVHSRLAMVGLADAHAKSPSELSGGMRKRCALARAIVLEPRLLFLDEPTSGADPVTAAVLDELVLDLTRRIGATALVVTHEMRSAFRLSHEILMLWRGCIHHRGSPASFIETDDPVINQFVQGRRHGPLASE